MTDSLDYTQREERGELAKAVADTIRPLWFDTDPTFEECCDAAARVVLEWHTRQLQELREALTAYDSASFSSDEKDRAQVSVWIAARSLAGEE